MRRETRAPRSTLFAFFRRVATPHARAPSTPAPKRPRFARASRRDARDGRTAPFFFSFFFSLVRQTIPASEGVWRRASIDARCTRSVLDPRETLSHRASFLFSLSLRSRTFAPLSGAVFRPAPARLARAAGGLTAERTARCVFSFLFFFLPVPRRSYVGLGTRRVTAGALPGRRRPATCCEECARKAFFKRAASRRVRPASGPHRSVWGGPLCVVERSSASTLLCLDFFFFFFFFFPLARARRCLLRAWGFNASWPICCLSFGTQGLQFD